MNLPKPWLFGLLAAALVVYLTMWFGWALGWDWVVGTDTSALNALHRFGVANPAWLSFWQAFCTVFGPLGFRLIAIVPIGFAIARKQWRVAVFLFFSVELSGVVTEIAKIAANRPRPLTAFVEAASTSFPSGHALCAMAGVLALSVIVLPTMRWSLRRWWIAAGAGIVVAVGFGRVALNVHNPSDVVAGWVLGFLYFAACLLILGRRRVSEVADIPAALGTAP